ncbi:MAG: putative damage-inducible protein DinB [Planctomycetota bacterium]|jgi:uncharacterized damage-inducible protein DinB
MSAFVDRICSSLQPTPSVLQAWLTSLPEALLRADEGQGTWSPYDILGHLIHGERTDWIPRLQIILKHGCSRPFDPFDRFAQQSFDPKLTTSDLLQTFAELRRENLATLEALKLSDADLARTGMHPDPTISEVTAQHLLATWAAHDLGHIAQTARVMAKTLSDEVGPWRPYIPIITR